VKVIVAMVLLVRSIITVPNGPETPESAEFPVFSVKVATSARAGAAPTRSIAINMNNNLVPLRIFFLDMIFSSILLFAPLASAPNS
jgi:hypothetical protein